MCRFNCTNLISRDGSLKCVGEIMVGCVVDSSLLASNDDHQWLGVPPSDFKSFY